MAFYDNALLLSNAQAITTTAASTTIYDVTGAGAGNAPSMTFGTGNNVGVDIGNADGLATPHAFFLITTAGTGAGTVTFQVQAAPASGNNAGTYVTLASSQAFVGTSLLLGSVVDLPIPSYASAAAEIGAGMGALPRFYRLNYVVASSATVSVTGYIGINPPLGYVSTQLGNNFTSV